tara:strand:+ start:113 stop:739 length:627 start_codon:yes stop_codon:yes gene_type:complete
MVNKKSEALLMDINPNLDEIIAEENTVADTENGEEHIVMEKEEVATHNSVFTEPKPKQPKRKGLSREEKAQIKEEERLRKEEQKAKRREETAERNRERARLRYYEQKEKQQEQKKVEKEIPKKIVEKTEQKLNNFQKQEVAQKIDNNMDFHTFASYMMKYEDLKTQYAKQQQQQQPKPVEKAKPKYHPDNYPIGSVYRHKRSIPNNFF